jgi:hypothetical protein
VHIEAAKHGVNVDGCVALPRYNTWWQITSSKHFRCDVKHQRLAELKWGERQGLPATVNILEKNQICTVQS